jgi:hypothetical protein
LECDGHTLRWKERSALVGSVEGFTEHFSTFTGRAWVAVEGPGWRIPIEAGYGTLRADLRRWFPDRPFRAEWADGRFPPARFGLPCDLLLAVSGAAVLGLAMGLSAGVGPTAGAAVLVAAVWPLARLRDAVFVREEGISVGPSWARRTPWHEVVSVTHLEGGLAARVWVETDRGSVAATLPRVLLPAFRARILRLGGVNLGDDVDDVSLRYATWQAPAAAAPWGVLLGTVVGASLVARPWPILTGGLLVMAALAMLSAAIEARSTGWGAGGIFWFAGVYATVLVSLVVGGLL